MTAFHPQADGFWGATPAKPTGHAVLIAVLDDGKTVIWFWITSLIGL
jgi:hypothetical protein